MDCLFVAKWLVVVGCMWGIEVLDTRSGEKGIRP